MPLTFKQYQQTLREFNYTPHWDLPHWGNALAGETGELCNLIKKVDRKSSTDPSLDDVRESMAFEFCDIIAYITHVANAIDIELSDYIPKKFNIVAERQNSTMRIKEGE